jgi:ribosomal protein L34E
MSPLFEPDKEVVRHERAVTSLCDRTGAPLAEVRSLFAQEQSRLELSAKVRSYLAVLTASNVRAMLRRKDT